MKHLFYAFILVGASALFSCNSSPNAGTAGNTDSTGVVDSATGLPVPEQSTATTPMTDEPAAPAASSSSSASSSSNDEEATPAPAPQVTYQQFYDELSPYGKWVNYPDQGYVWQPSVDQSFQPYSSNGHWVYSNDGWTWNSDYKWGWAAFHYGRWFHEDKYGWLWKPGNEWAPAWVKWGQSGDNYGWAPLAPGISVSASWNPPPSSWNFVHKQDITRPDVNKYVVAKTQNTTIVKNVTVINNVTNITNNNKTVVINKNSNNKTVVNNNKTTVNNSKIVNNNKVANNNKTVAKTTVNNNVTVKGNNNTVYNKGPQITDVEKVTKTRVQPVTITNDNKPGASHVQNNKMVVYRPAVKEDPKSKPRVEQTKRPNPKGH